MGVNKPPHHFNIVEEEVEVVRASDSVPRHLPVEIFQAPPTESRPQEHAKGITYPIWPGTIWNPEEELELCDY